MSNNFYEILWINKNATKEEIKKAYRKKAMQYHPDRNKWNKSAEETFKKVNEAYEVLSDDKKKKQYDTFWSASWTPFSSYSWWNPFEWSQFSDFSWFEDIFSNMWNSRNSSSFEFNLDDLFWNFAWSTTSSRRKTSSRKSEPKKEETLDFEKTYEVPIFDLILWCKIEVTWVYWQKAKLTIPAKTKSWTKFRVKDFWKSDGRKKGNLIVKVEWVMPKIISDVDLQMLRTIRDNVGY
jgi:DnaJ-class molecular chaperone